MIKKASRRIRIADSVITSELPNDAYLRLEVYDILGRRVETLLHGKQQAGHRTVFWDASGVPCGLYFYKLTAQDGGGGTKFSQM